MAKWVRSEFDEREHAVAEDGGGDVLVAEFLTDHDTVEDTGPIPAIIAAVEALCGARLTVSSGRHAGAAQRCERCVIVVRARVSSLPLSMTRARRSGRASSSSVTTMPVIVAVPVAAGR